MDLVDQLLGANGCSVEGTEIQNPINSLVNALFESNAGISGGEYLGDNGLVEESPLYSEVQPNFQIAQVTRSDKMMRMYLPLKLNNSITV